MFFTWILMLSRLAGKHWEQGYGADPDQRHGDYSSLVFIKDGAKLAVEWQAKVKAGKSVQPANKTNKGTGSIPKYSPKSRYQKSRKHGERQGNMRRGRNKEPRTNLAPGLKNTRKVEIHGYTRVGQKKHIKALTERKWKSGQGASRIRSNKIKQETQVTNRGEHKEHKDVKDKHWKHR